MIRLLWRTDVHLSDKAPSSRTDDWADTVFHKLGQIRDLAKRLNADAIIDGGDFFHIKAPSRNSHELVRRALDHHTGYPCPVYSVPGNHDSVYGDYAFLPQQPLGVLHASGVFKPLYDDREALIEKDGLKVRLIGVPYHGARYDMSRFYDIKRKDEDFLFCAAHVLASRDGGQMFEGEDIIRYSDLEDTAPDVYAFGHWHKDQGVQSIGDKQFINIGSLTRGSLSQDEVQRQPACALLTFEQGKPVDIKVVRLKVRPPEEVFDVEGRARQVQRQEDMDEFVARIRDALFSTEDGKTLGDMISEMPELPDQVRERALTYLEAVK
jgi:DNA repair exonuclease SbcCD nuclease subunit